MLIIRDIHQKQQQQQQLRKNWVSFDTSDSESEDEAVVVSSVADPPSESVKIEQRDQKFQLHVDLNSFDSVEVKLTKKFSRESRVLDKKFYADGQLEKNLELLRQSGFYYERGTHTAEECTRLLASTDPGTFLVRDSSDPKFLFTLSLQTEKGPTSVRLVYIEGLFRLDAADQRLIGALPGFPTVVALVQYYVDLQNKSYKRQQVWIDATTGRTHSSVNLRRPLLQQVPSLKHASRLALNKWTSTCDNKSSLPESVRKYLNSYPNHL